MPKVYNLLGQQFDRITILAPSPRKGTRSGRYWFGVCTCGNFGEWIAIDLRDGNTRSCGCLAAENRRKTGHGNRTHGEASTRTPEYKAWLAMIQRCERPGAINYAIYGGRGIRVCDKWRRSYEVFLGDVGRKPSPKHTLDRIDTDSNYEPENVQWASPKEQARNRRDNRLLTHNGKTQCVLDWSTELDISFTTITSRLDRGWSVEKTLDAPVDTQHSRGNRPMVPVLLEFAGETHNIREWSRIKGIPYSALSQRISKLKWDVERALTTPVQQRT